MPETHSERKRKIISVPQTHKGKQKKVGSTAGSKKKSSPARDHWVKKKNGESQKKKTPEKTFPETGP